MLTYRCSKPLGNHRQRFASCSGRTHWIPTQNVIFLTRASHVHPDAIDTMSVSIRIRRMSSRTCVHTHTHNSARMMSFAMTNNDLDTRRPRKTRTLRREKQEKPTALRHLQLLWRESGLCPPACPRSQLWRARTGDRRPRALQRGRRDGTSQKMHDGAQDIGMAHVSMPSSAMSPPLHTYACMRGWVNEATHRISGCKYAAFPIQSGFALVAQAARAIFARGATRPNEFGWRGQIRRAGNKE